MNVQDRCIYLENAYFQNIHHIYYTTYKTSMCMIDVVIEILPACEFLIAFITLICLCCLFTPSTMILQLTARTSAKNPVVQVKDVDVRNDDKEPFENDTKLFECKNMVDIKV